MSSQEEITIISQRSRLQPTMPPVRYQPPRAIHNTHVLPKFMELPNELQMQIWSHAAGSIGLGEAYLDESDNNMPACYFPPKIVVYRFRGKYNFDPNDLPIVLFRNHLMATCRLSRLIALEVWKREVSKITVAAWGPGISGWMRAMQSRKLKVVDELIGMVKAYMEGREVEFVQIRERRPLPE